MLGINPGDSFTFHECNELLSPKPTINISNITLLIGKLAGWMGNVPLSNTADNFDSIIILFIHPISGSPIQARGILKIY